jgi:uncharacterized membrane protein YdjX (TVP38/TMEM64 family)
MARLLAWAAVILIVLTDSSYAYLDPGTGSFLLQAMIGALASAAAFFGIFRQKIRDAWSRFIHKRQSN